MNSTVEKMALYPPGSSLITSAIDQLAKSAEEILAEQEKKVAAAVAKAFFATKRFNVALEESKKGHEIITRIMHGEEIQVDLTAMKLQQLALEMRNANEAAREAKTASGDLREALVEQGYIAEENIATTEATGEATDELTEKTSQYIDTLNLIPPAWEVIGESEVQAAERARGVLQARLAGVKGYTDAAKKVFNNMYAYRKQIIQNSLNAEIKAEQKKFAFDKAQIEKKYTVEGQLTEEGLQKMGELEEGHASTVTNIKERARQKELTAKKRMVPAMAAEAVINTAVAVTKVLPNLILAGLIAAAGAIEVATIFAQGASIQGAFAKGGQFTVPGTGGTDSQTVILRATPGEEFFAVPPGGWRPTNMPGFGGGGGLDILVQAVDRTNALLDDILQEQQQVVAVESPDLYRLVVDSLGPELQNAIENGELTFRVVASGGRGFVTGR